MMGKMMGIDYITVLTWLKYWILQLPPLRQINPQQTKVAGIFLWLFENGPIPGGGQGK